MPIRLRAIPMAFRRPLMIAAACAALAVLPAGCGGGGGGGDTSTPQDAARAYVQARNQGDAGRVCELYSEQLISRLHASNCEAFVREQSSGVATSLTLVSVRQSGDTATATLQATVAGQGGEGARLRIALSREGGDWKITSLGGSGPD